MQDIIDCPQCGDRVLPQEDGRCPACSGDTRARIEGALVSCRIRSLDAGVMPAICLVCGGATDDSVVITRSRAQEEAIPSPIAFLLNPLHWFFRREIERESISIPLPVHRGCRIDDANVLSVDHMTDCFLMRVHPAFRQACQAAIAAE